MTRVGVSGAAGRMGRLVAQTIADAQDLELAGLFDPAGAGAVVAGLDVSPDPASLSTCEVVVEFTNPTVVLENLARWREFGAHAVVGTSGFDEARIDAVRVMWPDGPPNCLVAPNFSIGAVVMMRLAELAAPHFDAVEVIALHHDAKADAPSGTSLESARRIASAKAEQRRAVESEELLSGARGADASGVRIHSVRLPGLLAHQRVLLGSAGETVTIGHDTTDRASFMPGVLLGVRSVGDLDEPVTVGLEELLGL